MTSRNKIIEAIAKEHLALPTLELQAFNQFKTRELSVWLGDAENIEFHELSIEQIRAALEAAYEAGRSKR